MQPDIKHNTHRRTYSKAFKAELVAQCLYGQDSVASIAMHHGINANLLQRWIREHQRYGQHEIDETASAPELKQPANWIALPMSKDSVPASLPRTSAPNHKQSAQGLESSLESIKLSVTGTEGLAVELHWPVKEALQLAGFVRTLLT